MLLCGKNTVMTGALVCLGLTGCAQQTSKAERQKGLAEFKIPPEDSGRANPFTFGPESIAEGKRFYDATDCSLCHGSDGGGQGFLAKAGKYNLLDWRDPTSLRKYTDGDVYYIIAKGKRSMPSYEMTQTPRQMWQMTNYVRSLASNAPAPKP
jgi:mono/diheme cytochrome c family protein